MGHRQWRAMNSCSAAEGPAVTGGAASAREDMARAKSIAGHTRHAIRFICGQPVTRLALL
jgi:hypothetical protein